MKKIGVIIGRFQLDDFHKGHKYLLEKVIDLSEKTIVLLGCSVVKLSQKNPLDYETRKAMLLQYYPELVILPLNDNKSDSVWSCNVDETLDQLTNNNEAILHYSRDSFIYHYNGKYQSLAHNEASLDSATIRRLEIATMKPLASKDFRTGIIYAATHQYTRVNAVVDMFVYNHETGKVLLGRRKDEENWRLFGGFSDPSDLSFKHTAKRELKEESGLDIPIGNFECVDSFQIDDWRFRNDRDKIITTLYWVDADPELASEAKGDDDINEVDWFDIKDVFATVNLPFIDGGFNIVSEHAILIQAAYQHWLEISHIYG